MSGGMKLAEEGIVFQLLGGDRKARVERIVEERNDSGHVGEYAGYSYPYSSESVRGYL